MEEKIIKRIYRKNENTKREKRNKKKYLTEERKKKINKK